MGACCDELFLLPMAEGFAVKVVLLFETGTIKVGECVHCFAFNMFI
jgi:hypothetical protein